MPKNALYTLKGYGMIEPCWLQGCFALFKEGEINIRKLVLLKNGNPDCFSMLEIHFVLPPLDGDGIGNPQHPFMEQLTSCLSTQDWAEQTLTLN